MLALLKFVDARLGEASTYSSIAVFLALVHFNVDPGMMHVVALWGAVAAGGLGVLLSEVGTGKTAPAVASDVLSAIVTAVKNMPAATAAVMLLLSMPVTRLVMLLAFALPLLAACGADGTAKLETALASPPGRLFCAIQTEGGGSFVAGLTAAALTNAAPAMQPIFVLATNAGKDAVDHDCANAAASVPGGTSGVPVSPPVNPDSAAQIAIIAPRGPTTGPQPTL